MKETPARELSETGQIRRAPENLARGERCMQEDDAGFPALVVGLLLLAITQHLGEEHQVVVVNPHNAVAAPFLPDTGIMHRPRRGPKGKITGSFDG